MDLDKQVCTLEQGKRLQELGVEGSFLHHFNGEIKSEAWGADYYPAFSVAELGAMLPDEYYSKRTVHGWICYNTMGINPASHYGFGRTEAEARAYILIHLLETGKLTPEEVNQRLSNQ